MRNVAARVVVIAGVAAVYLGFCALTYVVVGGMALDTRVVGLILQTISLTISIWVLLIFTVVRILFMKADKIIELTYTFPVTNKQRLLACTLFEASVVLTGVVIVAGPLTLAVLFHSGIPAFPDILFGLFGQAIVLYLLLYAVYLCLERLLLVLKISRWRSLVIPSFLGLLFFGVYNLVNWESEKLINLFYDGGTYYGFARIFVMVYDYAGMLAALLVLLGSVCAALSVIVLVAPNDYVRVKYFFKVPIGTSCSSLLSCNIRAVVRSGEFLLAVFLVIAISTGVYFLPQHYAPYWLSILSLQAVYAVPTCAPMLRIYRFRLRPELNYLLMLAPYLIVEMLFALPIFTIYLTKGLTFVEIVKTLFACLFTLIASLGVSVFFPAEKYNPFSVIVGVATAFGFVVLIVFTALVWTIPDWLFLVIWTAAAGLCVFYSVLGLSSTQKRDYYAID